MISLLRPTYIATGIEALTPEAIERRNIKLVGLDVDGCLSDYHAKEVEPAVRGRLEELGRASCALVIISNAYGERVDELGELYGDLVKEVITPLTVTRLGELPSMHRKPSPAMLEYAMATHGVSPEETIMVGDQMFKDVLSANRAGVSSLLLSRRGQNDHPGVRLQRIPEAIARGMMGLPVSSRAFHGDTTGVNPLPQYAL